MVHGKSVMSWVSICQHLLTMAILEQTQDLQKGLWLLSVPFNAKLEAGVMVTTFHGAHLHVGISALVLIKTVALAASRCYDEDQGCNRKVGRPHRMCRLNWKEAKSSSLVKAGDIISCAGKGRCEVKAVEMTKKERYAVQIMRYV